MDNFWKVLSIILILLGGAAFIYIYSNKSNTISTPVNSFNQPSKKSLTDDKLEDRRNLYQMVEIEQGNMQSKLFGGFNELKLTIKNHSKYNIDLVSIEVKVYKSNGDLYSDEVFHSEGIEAFGQTIIEVPAKNRGTKYRASIVKLRCDELNYDYDEIPR